MIRTTKLGANPVVKAPEIYNAAAVINSILLPATRWVVAVIRFIFKEYIIRNTEAHCHFKSPRKSATRYARMDPIRAP